MSAAPNEATRSDTQTPTTPRDSYHHGDLREALIRAGLEATRSDGPGALSVREVARRVGVSPSATYRHFANRQALLGAVAARIHEDVADRMTPEVDTNPDDARPDARADALAQLRAVGLGYVAFAFAEPGWFSVAFFGEPDADTVDDASRVTDGVAIDSAGSAPTAPPFVLLRDALDGLVSQGVLTPQRREHAEWSCFAAVHGFTQLVLHGPLRHLDPASRNVLAARAVDDVIRGLIAPEAATGARASR